MNVIKDLNFVIEQLQEIQHDLDLLVDRLIASETAREEKYWERMDVEEELQSDRKRDDYRVNTFDDQMKEAGHKDKDFG